MIHIRARSEDSNMLVLNCGVRFYYSNARLKFFVLDDVSQGGFNGFFFRNYIEFLRKLIDKARKLCSIDFTRIISSYVL